MERIKNMRGTKQSLGPCLSHACFFDHPYWPRSRNWPLKLCHDINWSMQYFSCIWRWPQTDISFFFVITAGQRSTTPIHKSAWFIALLVLVALLLLVLIIFVLYTRHRGAKYPGKSINYDIRLEILPLAGGEAGNLIGGNPKLTLERWLINKRGKVRFKTDFWSEICRKKIMNTTITT